MELAYRFDPKNCQYRVSIVRYIAEYDYPTKAINFDMISNYDLRVRTEEEAHQLAKLLQAEEYEIYHIKNTADFQHKIYDSWNPEELVFTSPRLKAPQEQAERLRVEQEDQLRDVRKKLRDSFMSKPASEIVFTASNGVKLVLTRSIYNNYCYDKKGEFTVVKLYFDNNNNQFYYHSFITTDGKILKKQLTKYLTLYHQFTSIDCEAFISQFKSICQRVESENGKAV